MLAMADKRAALVLSGGGAKTAAHLGAWRAFAEAQVVPAHLVAVSMGAVVAAALAAGIDAQEVLARLVDVGRGSLVPDADAPAAGLGAKALFRTEGLRQAIEAVVPVRTFGELKLPLTVPVVDLDTSEVISYGIAGRDAPLLDVLCATCALPVYFPPVALDGRRCGDGGLGGVLPLEAASDIAATVDLVLAVDVGPGADPAVNEAPPGAPPLLRAHDDAMGALMAATTRAQLARWRAESGQTRLLYVRPPVERYATFRIDRLEHYASAGYEAARGALDSAHDLLRAP